MKYDAVEGVEELIEIAKSMSLSRKLENQLVSTLERAIKQLTRDAFSNALRILLAFDTKVEREMGKGLTNKPMSCLKKHLKSRLAYIYNSWIESYV